MVILYILILLLSTTVVKTLSKYCSNIVSASSVASYSLYLMFNGAIACIFFFISSNFKLSINLATALYSLIFAFVVIMSLIGIFMYRFTNIATVTILTSACGLVATSALGIILFDEAITVNKIIQILIMLVAVTLTFYDKNKRSKKSEDMKKPKRNILLLLAVTAIVTVASSSSTIITKYYALDTRVADESSFFFFTNLFLMLIAAIFFTVDSIISKERFKDALTLLHPKKSIGLIGKTVFSNIYSLVGILLIAIIDVSAYSPLSSAIVIISGVIASIIWRERLGVLSYLAALIACVVVFI